MQRDFKNYYEILEVPESASNELIFESYQRIKNAFSNDNLAMYSLLDESESNAIIELIEEAYSILSTPDKRKQYDHARGLNQNNHHSSHESEEKAEGKEFVLNPNQSLDHAQEFNIKQNVVEVSKIAAHKRFGLNFERNEQFEEDIEKATLFTGTFLQKIREYKNVDIQRMSDMTKISKSYISAIEEEALNKLPNLVYVRGFVYQYAKCLKLDPTQVASSYINHLKEQKAS